MRINGQAPGVMAEEARRLGIPLVHYSTNYVFDGKLSRPHLEADAVAPVNSYGYGKLQGEEAVRAVTDQHLLLRMSWIYAVRGKNFLFTMLRIARQKNELKVVSDVCGAPTWARMIADATLLALMSSLEMHSSRMRLRGGRPGTYHLTASGSTSWFGFAKQIFDAASPDLVPVGGRLRPIPAHEYPAPAARPSNSVLANERFEQTFGLRLPDWRLGVDLCVAELRESRAAGQSVGLA